MRLAYCTDCKPPQVVACGPMSAKSTPTHLVGEKVHGSVKVIPVPDLRPMRGEKPQAFLNRVAVANKNLMT